MSYSYSSYHHWGTTRSPKSLIGLAMMHGLPLTRELFFTLNRPIVLVWRPYGFDVAEVWTMERRSCSAVQRRRVPSQSREST